MNVEVSVVVSCAIYSYVSIVLHEVPVPDPPYNCYGFVSHAWGSGAKYELIQWSEKVFAYPLVLIRYLCSQSTLQYM
jgi:hypothetical protein